jgi:chaperone modulatory protein CbpM
MIDFAAVIALVKGLEEAELRRWIAERWVQPEAAPSGYVFHEVDVARIRLILELRQELAIGEEALPVVLQLLDQVYGLRRRLRALCQVIDAQPPEIREALRGRLLGAAKDE